MGERNMTPEVLRRLRAQLAEEKEALAEETVIWRALSHYTEDHYEQMVGCERRIAAIQEELSSVASTRRSNA